MSTAVSYFIFYLIMFVIESGKTSGMSPTKGVQSATTDTFQVVDEWAKGNDDASTTTTTTRRKREVAGNVVVEEGKLNHMKMLLEKFYRYKNFRKPKTSNALMSNGWGAGGMPFNVLYTPNSHQQKILRFTPKGNRKETPPRREQETVESQRRKDESERKQPQQHQHQQQQHVTPRKYFSVIPQLFASYGWRIH